MTINYVINAAMASSKLPMTKSAIEDIQFAQVSEKCCKPDDSDPVHAFGNWNDIRSRDESGAYGYGPHVGQVIDNTPGLLGNILEKMGIELEWYDEWTMCDDCLRMFRTQPNSYDWKMFGRISDGSAVCGHCINPEEYLEERINNPRNAVNTDLVNPAEHGFKHLNGEFENGLHPGQNDDPKRILKEYLEKFPGKDLVFSYEPSQFYVSFHIWGRDKESEIA